jgi:hypothetical protein
MARIRQFKPAFFTDDKVGRLSRDARLFFFGVLSEADDEGRLVDAPKRLAGVIYPFDEDVTPKKVTRWIDELVEQQMVLRYTHEGGSFLYVRKFKAHQKMSHPTPSTLPPPPSGPGQSSGAPPEKLRSATGAPPETFAPVFEGVSVSEGVGVVERVGVPSGKQSSSKLSSVANAPVEEDGLVAEAVRILAKRRLVQRLAPDVVERHGTVNDRDGWLARTSERIRMRHGADMADMAAAGVSVEAMVAAVEPLASPPEAAAPEAHQWPDFEWVEDEHGFAVERRVSA